MRYFTILAGVFAATAMTNPTSNANATAELMEHFRADDAMKAYTYNLSLDALNNIAACKTTINTSTADDKPLRSGPLHLVHGVPQHVPEVHEHKYPLPYQCYCSEVETSAKHRTAMGLLDEPRGLRDHLPVRFSP
jgi:hypothetical protein